ncbi:hypothetical protein [Paraburkholderia sediminicola]|uniref:hypothetical protein n=1 Tax=Paraburkholderia sediminicola TaxID=458836 RepID=UPI0038BC36E7
MSFVPVLTLSKWAHYSWLPRGERALSERAQADANASLLARFAPLTSGRAIAPVPPFAALPRPACAKVMRVAAAFANARSLRRVVSATAREMFASLVGPQVLSAIQRNARPGFVDIDVGATLNVFDRADMTAAGLQIALHAIDDPAGRVLLQLRLPVAVAQRASRFQASDISPQAASDVLEAAYALAGGKAC